MLAGALMGLTNEGEALKIMEFNTQSWHYWVLMDGFKASIYRGNFKVSLCKYFWMVVWSVLVTTLAVLLGTFFVSVLSIIVLAPIVSSISFYLGFGTLSIFGTVGVSTWILFVFSGLYVMNQLLDWCKDLFKWLRYKNYVREQAPKGLVGQYLKAKKDKVCPIIEFK